MNTNSLKSLQAQVALLATQLSQLMADPQEQASLREVPVVSPMAVRTSDDNSDPNIVRVHITEGYVNNRMTLPREIYTKSKRDSYIHSDREVTDPSRSYVIVNGVKYPQTSNQGRSSKIQVSTFGAREGQTVVFTRVKGNQWESVVKGKASVGSAPTKVAAKSVKAPKSLSTGKSAGRFQVAPPVRKGQAVTPPQAKAKSPSKAPQAISLKDALIRAKKQIEANYAEGFVNQSIADAAERRGDDPTPRMHLTTKENKALQAIAKDNGSSLIKCDKILRKAFGW